MYNLLAKTFRYVKNKASNVMHVAKGAFNNLKEMLTLDNLRSLFTLNTLKYLLTNSTVLMYLLRLTKLSKYLGDKTADQIIDNDRKYEPQGQYKSRYVAATALSYGVYYGLGFLMPSASLLVTLPICFMSYLVFDSTTSILEGYYRKDVDKRVTAAIFANVAKTKFSGKIKVRPVASRSSDVESLVESEGEDPKAITYGFNVSRNILALDLASEQLYNKAKRVCLDKAYINNCPTNHPP
jgi:hypothetical protein